MIRCDKCQSENVKFYKQRRVDGVWVVVARCEHGHNPNKYKPFYPVYNFHLDTLPEVETAPKAEYQLSMLEQILKDAEQEYKK